MNPDVSFLEVNDLRVHFPVYRGIFRRQVGSVYAVDGVSFKMMRGKTVGIVGESGCGKTTVARAIVKLNQNSGGHISFEGMRIDDLSESQFRPYRRKIQMIFQDPSSALNPRITVENLLAEVLQVHGLFPEAKKRKERVEELMAQVGLLPAHLLRYPHEFSGGQRQRINIARALAVAPQLMICDESVSALDVSVQAQILNLLNALQKSLGLSLLFISHDLGVIRHISDVVIVMYLGKVVEMAERTSLYDRPAHPYTQALLAAAPVLAHQTNAYQGTILQGDVPSPSAPPSGCAFHPRCPKATSLCSEESPPPSICATGTYQAHTVFCHHASGRDQTYPKKEEAL